MHYRQKYLYYFITTYYSEQSLLPYQRIRNYKNDVLNGGRIIAKFQILRFIYRVIVLPDQYCSSLHDGSLIM